MSDIRATLAEALRDQHAMAYDEDAAMYWCDCGKAAGDYRDWAEHVADVLLSLEGVAIVAVSEQTGTTNHGLCFGMEVMTYRDRVLIGTEYDISTGYARELAAALLAAADAAEAANDA